MGPLDWAATVGGALVVALVLLDVILTVLHPDHEGPIARRVQRFVWVVARAPGRGIPIRTSSGRSRPSARGY